jgi:hypothetical protein
MCYPVHRKTANAGGKKIIDSIDMDSTFLPVIDNTLLKMMAAVRHD